MRELIMGNHYQHWCSITRKISQKRTKLFSSIYLIINAHTSIRNKLRNALVFI